MSLLQKYENIISSEDIEYILNLPEVKDAKISIDNKINGSIYFSIHLTDSIRESLKDKFNLDFSNMSSIPMRWIKGDTHPHFDKGIQKFQKTHLVYLNNNPGKLIVDGSSYPIVQGCGYIFDEGLSHETIETGLEPRLLLGPMSEEGFAVGAATTIYADGQTDTIYFIDLGISGIYYNINNGTNYGISLPVTIVNTNTSYTLKVLFENNLTFSTSLWYFICGSDNIQFGSTSLNTDGSRPIITIDSVINYPGLINNGSSFSDGFNNIYIYNLMVTTSGGSTLVSDGGWIGQSYFGKNRTNNYIVNCSSDGPIIDAGGGIIGGYAAQNGIMKIIGCSSSGISGVYSGGIIGFRAGQSSGNVTCESCWSTGIIGQDSGGIFGYQAGNSGIVEANECYSSGFISLNGGGIFGSNGGDNGSASAFNCYSIGNIGTNAGGIFGENAALSGGTTTASNCYSTGTITTSGNGIYGSNKQVGAIETNCYSANGSWNTSTANLYLTGIPNSIIGTTWVASVINQPYELLNMGYTPYNIINILTTTTPTLNQTYTSSLKQGNSSSSAIVNGLSYEILQISGGTASSYSKISINNSTGIISTTSSTKPGVYTLYVRNNGSYNITEYSLTVSKKSKKKNKKNKPLIYFNNTQGSTTIISCKKSKSRSFYWCS